MLILFITKKTNHETAVNSSEDFARHNEAVKQFRLSHPALSTSRARDIVTEEGALLAPVYGVRLDANTKN
jgi:hypothetical protein